MQKSLIYILYIQTLEYIVTEKLCDQQALGMKHNHLLH